VLELLQQQLGSCALEGLQHLCGRLLAAGLQPLQLPLRVAPAACCWRPLCGAAPCWLSCCALAGAEVSGGLRCRRRRGWRRCQLLLLLLPLSLAAQLCRPLLQGRLKLLPLCPLWQLLQRACCRANVPRAGGSRHCSLAILRRQLLPLRSLSPLRQLGVQARQVSRELRRSGQRGAAAAGSQRPGRVQGPAGLQQVGRRRLEAAPLQQRLAVGEPGRRLLGVPGRQAQRGQAQRVALQAAVAAGGRGRGGEGGLVRGPPGWWLG
jgi:hypothetical protein